jgi:hypothetical protein
MSGYFTRERFGRPQFLAGLILLAFLAQAGWLVRSQWHAQWNLQSPISEPSIAQSQSAQSQIQMIQIKTGAEEAEGDRIAAGWRQWHGRGIAGAPYRDAEAPEKRFSETSSTEDDYDTERSPLLPLVSAAPLLPMPERWWNSESFAYWGWLTRLPFLACGVLLGASLWYVARRLCGNHGGFVALSLYCFSPAMIQATAVWHTEPEIVAAWGAFGAIFTAIAVAHTLYAPREVVLWNGRRIVLLGTSLAIATGAQFSMVVVVPVALAFLLYVAWASCCCSRHIFFIRTRLPKACATPPFGERPGEPSPSRESTDRSRHSWGARVRRSLWRCQWRWWRMPCGRARVTSATPRRSRWRCSSWCWAWRTRTSAAQDFFWPRCHFCFSSSLEFSPT